MSASFNDPFLASRLARRLPGRIASDAKDFLTGIEQVSPLLDAHAAKANANPPVLVTHDRMGNRIDEVVLHPSYRELEEWAYGTFGIVAMAHAADAYSLWGGYPRSVALAGGYAFGKVEQGMFCPLCMTDGAASVMAKTGDQFLIDKYVRRLISRGHDRWTGAMFLTEKQGGSDVGANACRAVFEDGAWRLHGEKWFCSNAGADVALVLARPDGAPAGTRGLGLFAMPRIMPDGTKNRFLIHRLKDKLGTRSMATGEVDLNGAFADLVGSVDRGFAQMSDMINLSRLYNAVGSIAAIGRSYQEALGWATDREAFGRKLIDFPMVRDTLDALAAELDGGQALVWELVGRIDRLDAGLGNDVDRRIVRILGPLAKLYTAKRAVWAASEAIEILGGNGYVEEFSVARFLRDAQVLPIWEGTTNIQVLDLFRAIEKDASHEPLFQLARTCLEATPPACRAVADRALEHLDELESALAGLIGEPGDAWTVPGREWAFKLAPAICAALLIGEASVAQTEDVAGLNRRAEKLLAMHLEGWTAMGLLRGLESAERLRPG